MPSRYDHLTHDELTRLLEARDRRDATRFGLVWEANEIERDRAINADFVALDLDTELSTPEPAGGWRNLIIEGDNFDALRHLRMTCAGKVKCIYIDPPYNTGNRDFVYNDRFVDVNDSWRHSTWCEFMYQRLMLAKDLLTQDGVIFVSIDDNEIFALGMLMNKVFGQHSFIANCIWQKRYSRENRGSIGDAHEYILVYAPRPEVFQEKCGRIPLTETQAKVYKNLNNDPKGRWRAIPMTAQGFRPNQMYEVVTPTGAVHRPPEGRCWGMTEAPFLKLKEEGRIWFGKDGSSQPGVIRYLSEVDGVVPWTWWPHEEVGHTDEARKEIREWLETQTAFDTPKPVRLMERILQIANGPDDIILDFFAGSGTTAHAVMKLNAEDGGKRRFILVSSTEATTAEPDKNLCRDVCAKRVRRVIEGYGDNAALGGDFAYLRCRRIAPGRLLDIEHAQVWTALQMIHLETLKPYDGSARAPFQSAGDEMARLIYVPRFTKELVPALRAAVADCAAVALYSWQPETLRQHIRSGNVQHEAIPESLARKFGLNA
ncbi:site-specific DNA-methyltransferase [Prosthecobacter sp.]|uniref:site-specific DNA-methyltransferase n=1 Tax=Prosthecobacter sp. TaxID=1965333 RepID=UPI00248991F1|nr:site-specific DNA-methyltransferase [Prosthecobacter sp.]MDI1311146.1 site-specific DNA-methyltransferase [Prosthecobacter sp.]